MYRIFLRPALSPIAQHSACISRRRRIPKEHLAPALRRAKRSIGSLKVIIFSVCIMILGDSNISSSASNSATHLCLSPYTCKPGRTCRKPRNAQDEEGNHCRQRLRILKAPKTNAAARGTSPEPPTVKTKQNALYGHVYRSYPFWPYKSGARNG